MTQDDWQALKAGDYARYSEKERAALVYADKMTRTPTNAATAEADALKQHFSDDQVVDIVCTVALANLTNRVTDGLGLELEFAPEKI